MPGGSVRISATRSLTFWPEQHAAATRLGALPDHDLDGVGGLQVGQIEPVPGRQALVDQQPGRLALLRGHAAVAGGGGGAHRGCRPAQRLLGVRGQRAEAHPGDRDRDRQLQRAARAPGAEHGGGVAALPVALQRVPGQRRGQEHQVIERRQLPLGAPAAYLVPADLGHLVDLADHLGREAVAPLGARPWQRAAIARRERPGRLRQFGLHQYFWSFSESKLYSCLADATLVTSSAEMWLKPAACASSRTRRTSSAPSSSTRASAPSDRIFPPT